MSVHVENIDVCVLGFSEPDRARLRMASKDEVLRRRKARGKH